MSRSTVAKSRQDKTSKTASAPTPAVTHEIVPGKFNDQDWNLMLDHDDGDEFILDIVEDVCGMAMDTIFKNYIQKQLVPYTVLQAKDAILQIIEWQFLSRDDGEGDITDDAGWMQDEEPAPAVTDCWAQGSVPRTIAFAQTPDPILEEDEEPLEEIKEEEENEEDIVEDEPEETPMLQSEPTVIVEESTSMAIEETVVEEEPEAKSRQSMQEAQAERNRKKKGRGYKRHSGPLKSAGVSRMTESLEEREMRMYMEEYNSALEMEMIGSPDLAMLQMPSSCHSILKLQAGRPPGNREVIYDEQGNVQSVVKINPAKLPSHRVKVNYKVVDPDVEAAQATLDAMRTGKHVASGSRQTGSKHFAPKPPELARPSSISSRSTGRNSLRGGQMQNYGRTRDGVTPLPPPLIESMEVAAGVIVKEGDRVKKGPRQRVKQTDILAAAAKHGLRAITITGGDDPQITVSQILQHQKPVVRPLAVTPPIPPIQQRSPVC